MMRGMYSAISGLKNHQIALDVTANDLANVNTVGYKGARTTFSDALSQTVRAGAASTAGSGGTNGAQVGLGVRLGSIDNMMGQGGFQSLLGLQLTSRQMLDADQGEDQLGSDLIVLRRKCQRVFERHVRLLELA